LRLCAQTDMPAFWGKKKGEKKEKGGGEGGGEGKPQGKWFCLLSFRPKIRASDPLTRWGRKKKKKGEGRG